jgi:hypothetical protein
MAMTECKRCMLDTNIFNRVVEEKLYASTLDGCRVFATPVQVRELSATTNADKRKRLLSAFETLEPKEVIPSAVWDDGNWDHATFSSEDGLYEKLSERLSELDARDKKKRGTEFNLSRDVRIAEASIRNDRS